MQNSYLKSLLGEGEQILFIHLEVQAYYDKDFAERMLLYWARILQHYGAKAVSLAILIDGRRKWKPSRFKFADAGCSLDFRFPVAKLLDWSDRREELESSPNLFADMVLAQLDTLATRKKPEERAKRKFTLLKHLAKRGVDPQKIREMMIFVQRLMRVPRAIDLPYHNELDSYQKENAMPYLSNFEYYAKKEGLEQGLEQGIKQSLTLLAESKFGEEGAKFGDELSSVTDLNKMKAAIRTAGRPDATLDDIRRILR